MSNLIDPAERALRSSIGLGPVGALVVVVGIAVVVAAVALAFPSYEAKALLQFPEPRRLVDDISTIERTLTQEDRTQLEKGNAIELAVFKRVAAAYRSPDELGAYLDAIGQQRSVAGERLLAKATRPTFWDEAAAPVGPLSKKDQREFGELKINTPPFLLGLDISATDRSAPVAVEMVGLLSGYFANAMVRERIRSWVVAGNVEARSTEKMLQAEIVRTELDIALKTRRAQEMRTILARYPDTARMDARQVISVSPVDGGERFLSPLAQVVGLESAVSQRQETIARLGRELRQKQLMAAYFASAEEIIKATPTVDKLVPALRELGQRTFSVVEAEQEWAKEVMLRVYGALDGFAVMQTQFGVRNGVEALKSASRDPLRLGLLGAFGSLVLISAVAFVRISLRGRDSAAG